MMGDVLDLLVALAPMVIAMVVLSYIMKMVSKTYGQKRLERVFNGFENHGVLSSPSVESVESKVCKNCKTNKAIDDGFDLCGMCKEDPKWWMVED